MTISQRARNIELELDGQVNELRNLAKNLRRYADDRIPDEKGSDAADERDEHEPEGRTIGETLGWRL